MMINHPEHYKEGTRVLLLSGRYKDGLKTQRKINKISHNKEEFSQKLDELMLLKQEGERIYVSAGSRDLLKAIRFFKQKQLDNDYNPDLTEFFKKIQTRWVSSLMSPHAQDKETKVWLFDCDTEEQSNIVNDFFIEKEIKYYRYFTKNGNHYLVKPFNKKLIPLNTEEGHLIKSAFHENPMMLWSY